MKRRTIIIWVVLLTGLITGLLILRWVYKPAETNVSSRKTDLELNASDLLTRYKENEEEANKEFLNKIILVEGTISNVSEENHGFSVYLKQGGEDAGVICSFEKSQLDTNKLEVGRTVKIKGICSGYLMDVVLNKCVLFE